MNDDSGTFSIVRMANTLSVSPSRYYTWLKACQQTSKRKLAQQTRDIQVKTAFDESKGRETYSSRTRRERKNHCKQYGSPV